MNYECEKCDRSEQCEYAFLSSHCPVSAYKTADKIVDTNFRNAYYDMKDKQDFYNNPILDTIISKMETLMRLKNANTEMKTSKCKNIEYSPTEDTPLYYSFLNNRVYIKGYKFPISFCPVCSKKL